MLGAYMLTQNDILTERTKPDSIAVCSFPIDSHDCRRVARGTTSVINEGTIFPKRIRGTRQGPAYQVPYRAITPKANECANLLVPVALATTHVAYSSVRVEPSWMTIGHSAGIAAAQQLILHVDAIVQEGLRDAAALRAVLVLHIPPAQRLHGGELDLLALQAAAGNGAVRVLCVALLGGAAAQQRPAHAHLALDAAVVAAQGVGDGLACLAQVGTAEKAGALACLRGGTALFGHGHFGLCQAGRRGVGACAVFQLGQ